MSTILNSIFGRQNDEIASFLDALSQEDHHKMASSFMQTQNISVHSGRYKFTSQLEVGETLLTRDDGPVEILDIQPLHLDSATVMPVVHVEKRRFVNSKELVLSPLHMVRCDIEHNSDIDHQPRYSAAGVALMQPVYARIGDLVDGDKIRTDFMLTTAFRQITLKKDAAIYVEGQAIKVELCAKSAE
jgi:hypothetical protein